MLIGGLVIAVIFLYCIGSENDREKVLSDFCEIECKKNIKNKYRFCC
jgi:hypothetical protein